MVQAIQPHESLLAKSEKIFQSFLAIHEISRKLNDVQQRSESSYRLVPSGPNRAESPSDYPPAPIKLGKKLYKLKASRKLNDGQRGLGSSYRLVPSGPNRAESPSDDPAAPIETSQKVILIEGLKT
ncbi:hypothetical protein H5410_025203 [Solanum commersonii]|uniref:Uncharacterized protein n=1 Tax=Solanum commersonii TaxID=4109 RepID=A0A9J5YVB3_SOLCO|nr:hypothetical protein H5410_025203 [Solanum commersonii]